jgi:hypothetical protein
MQIRLTTTCFGPLIGPSSGCEIGLKETNRSPSSGCAIGLKETNKSPSSGCAIGLKEGPKHVVVLFALIIVECMYVVLID